MEYDLLTLALRRTLDVTINVSSSLVPPRALLPSAHQLNGSDPWFHDSVNNDSNNGSHPDYNYTLSPLLEAGEFISKYYLWAVFAFGFP
ncbi:hypothetical protein RRG08_008340, partial [Elysia crispata]